MKAKAPVAKPPVPKSSAAKPPTNPVRRVSEDDASDVLAHAESPAGPDGTDGRVPGVPRQVSGAAKRVVASVVALAAILVVAGGLRAMQVRQQREADDARTRPADTAAAAIQSAPAWPVVTPTASAADTAPPGTSAAPASADTGSVASPGAAVDANDMAIHPPVDVPPLPPVIARETPIEGHDAPGASIVSQANHALARGATERALTLARQAVAANPSDADAWLILGAACQSSGDSAGAHEAYNNCLQRAHTANISECRLLARH